MTELPTLEQIAEILAYDPETGEFSWKVDRGNQCRAGTRAGKTTPGGYRQLFLGKRQLQAHRVAWLLTHGRWPNGVIDHIDGNPLNNRITNLRDCSRSENLGNMRRQKHNKSGFKGVTAHNGKWRAVICFKGNVKSLGSFPTKEAAAAAYKAAAIEIYGEFAKYDE